MTERPSTSSSSHARSGSTSRTPHPSFDFIPPIVNWADDPNSSGQSNEDIHWAFAMPTSPAYSPSEPEPYYTSRSSMTDPAVNLIPVSSSSTTTNNTSNIVHVATPIQTSPSDTSEPSMPPTLQPLPVPDFPHSHSPPPPDSNNYYYFDAGAATAEDSANVSSPNNNFLNMYSVDSDSDVERDRPMEILVDSEASSDAGNGEEPDGGRTPSDGGDGDGQEDQGNVVNGQAESSNGARIEPSYQDLSKVHVKIEDMMDEDPPIVMTIVPVSHVARMNNLRTRVRELELDTWQFSKYNDEFARF